MCKCSLARAGSSILLALICGSLSLASQRLSVSEGSGAAFRKRSVSYTDLSADVVTEGTQCFGSGLEQKAVSN